MAKLKIKNIFKALFNSIVYLFCFVIFLFFILLFIINLPPVKEKIAQIGIEYLNNTFKTKISVKGIEVDFFGNLVLHEVEIKDHHNFGFIKAKEVKGYTNTLSLIKDLNNIKINQIRLSEPIIRVITYKGEENDNFNVFIANFKSDKPKSNKIFKLEGRVDIVNGQFSIISRNQPQNHQTWLDATNLNLKITKVNVTNSDDTDVKILVQQFSFNGKRHGENYALKQLSGEIYYSPTELSFKDLLLESDSSLLLGSLYLKYDKANKMKDFANKVNWDLDLKENSKLSGKDLRYFVTNWNSNAILSLSSKVKGTLNNLTLTNPVLSVNKTIFYAPSLVLKNIANTQNNNNFSIKTDNASVQTSYESLNSWLPTFISKKIPKTVSHIGTANYKGNFFIDPNTITVKGNLVTPIGLAVTDAKLTNYSGAVPKYEGWIETTNLNLTPFIENDRVKNINSKITFEGQGFKLEDLNTKFDAHLQQLDLEGMPIHNISAIGSIKQKLFDGNIIIADKNIDANFNGNFDFSQKTLKTKSEIVLNAINLNYFLPNIKDIVTLKGHINSNIQFSNIDDLIGEINLENIALTKNDTLNHFNSIQIKTTSENGNRNFDVFSPGMITANIYGKYKLNDIPGMLREGIGSLLVNYKPRKRYDNQEFSFILDVQQNLFNLLTIDVNLSPGTTITGRYIGKNNQIQAQLISEYIHYEDNIKLISPNIFINSADSTQQFIGSLSSFKISNTSLDKLNFTGFKRNDSLFVDTHFNYGKNKEQQTNFDLNLYQTRIGNDLIFGFSPSNINFPQATWVLNPNFSPEEAIAKYNVITNKLTLSQLKLASNESEINLSGEFSSKDDFNVNLTMAKVELAKLIPQSLLKGMTFEGVANGNAQIVKNSRELKPLIDLNITGLKFNNQDLGDLFADATFDAAENKYLIDTKLINSGKENLVVNGYIQNEKNKSSQIDVELTANDFNIAPVGTFLQNIFSNFRGFANGNVHITGDLINPQYQGLISMDKVGFKVNFLGVDYQLTKEQDIQIVNGTFFLDNIELTDTVDKTQGTVFGALMTKNFSEWGLDLEFDTKKLLVLNTNITDNDLFFGKVWAKGNFYINGDTSKGINISAEATALEGSELTINSSSTSKASAMDYLKFVPEKVKDETEIEKPPLGLSIRAKVSADDKSLVKLIISQETGDRVEVRGNANNLLFDMNPAGVITMNGIYTITGDSKYFYQIGFNKEFDIVPKSTISWDGRGPADAIMNIEAEYTRGVNNLGDYLGVTTIPNTPIEVTAILEGTLEKPSISFKIDAPEVSTTIRDQLKNKIDNNEGEKMNQVASIVVFGTFLSNNMGGSSYVSSVYDVVLKQLTSIINNISGVFSIDTSFTGSDFESSNRLGINPKFKLNPRLSIVGDINMPLEQKYLADIWTYGGRIDYDISKNIDKSLVTSAFSKSSSFGIESNTGENNQAYGAGIVYKRDFNSFKELFKKDSLVKKEKDSLKAIRKEKRKAKK